MTSPNSYWTELDCGISCDVQRTIDPQQSVSDPSEGGQWDVVNVGGSRRILYGNVSVVYLNDVGDHDAIEILKLSDKGTLVDVTPGNSAYEMTSSN